MSLVRNVPHAVTSVMQHPLGFAVGSGLAAVLLVQVVARFSHVFSQVTPVDRFATKNTYAAATERYRSLKTDGSDHADAIQHSFFTPVQVIGLFRHGIRYPGKKDIANVGNIFAELQKYPISLSVLEKLQSVVSAMPMSNASQLAPAGAIEHQQLGHRFARKYLGLFNRLHADDVTFITSSSPRANASAKNFQKGFLTALKDENMSLPLDLRDDLMRYFDHCPRYIKEVDENYTALIEFHKFCSSIRGFVLQRIEHHLKIPKLDFTEKQLFSLYQFAAIEFAVLGTKHWADLLSSHNISAFEYAADLQEYWKMGYGYPINYQMTCPLVSHMFKHLDDTVNGNKNKKGIFYFGHAETVVPVLVAFGLFNDGFSLEAANFTSPDVLHRQFRVSRFSPFSANLALVLHEKDENKADFSENASEFDTNDRFLLELLVNEMPTKFPFASRLVWPYSDVRRKYEAYIDKCDFEKLCDAKSSAASHFL